MAEEQPNLLDFLVNELDYLIDEEDEEGLNRFFTKCVFGFRLSKSALANFVEEVAKEKSGNSSKGVLLAKKVLDRF